MNRLRGRNKARSNYLKCLTLEAIIILRMTKILMIILKMVTQMISKVITKARASEVVVAVEVAEAPEA